MLTLHHAPQSRSTRVIWLLEELGLPYEINYCDIRRGDGTGARDPSNPHPDGKVPALSHDGSAVSETAAVFLYLTDLLPEAGLGAGPNDPGREAYLTWLFWSAGEFGFALMSKFTGAPAHDARDADAFEVAMARVTGALEKGPYLMGERFSAVDILMGSTLQWARHLAPESEVLDEWLTRIHARPACARANAREFPPGQAVAA
jgi:glutathione S-transferase